MGSGHMKRFSNHHREYKKANQHVSNLSGLCNEMPHVVSFMKAHPSVTLAPSFRLPWGRVAFVLSLQDAQASGGMPHKAMALRSNLADHVQHLWNTPVGEDPLATAVDTPTAACRCQPPEPESDCPDSRDRARHLVAMGWADSCRPASPTPTPATVGARCRDESGRVDCSPSRRRYGDT